MIQQLVQRLVDRGDTPAAAAASVLSADPLDLAMAMEQAWDAAQLWGPATTVDGLRRSLWQQGAFAGALSTDPPPANFPIWDHLAYAFALENTRAVQVARKVVTAYRTGESLGIPSVFTQRWLDATESLLYGGSGLLRPWTATSEIRPSGEEIRRNLYWRVLGMDLAFGDEDNAPVRYVKASTANTSFVALFEELLHEIWQSITNTRNVAGTNTADDDRIFRLSQQLTFVLRARRQNQYLAREELVAVTALGWVELTLSTNTPVVIDLKAQATSASDRLRIIGERVGLAPHSRSGSFFAMASDLSVLLRAIEANYVTGPDRAWLYYADQPPEPLPQGARLLTSHARRIITEWSAATGRDLKQRSSDVRVAPQPAPAGS